jgi:hypothetical protein
LNSQHNKPSVLAELQSESIEISPISELEIIKKNRDYFSKFKETKSDDLLKVFTLSFLVKHHISHLANKLLRSNDPFEFYPMISSLGVHLIPFRETYCNFYDPYEKRWCSNHKVGYFCNLHKNEFLLQNASESETSFTKMHKYYSDIENLEEMDESTLDELITSFWEKFNQKGFIAQRPAQNDLKSALLFYDYTSFDELKEKGINNLKKKFYAFCLNTHPDKQKGNEESFIESRHNYEILKNSL